MSGMFRELDGELAVLVEGGVYKEAKLFVRRDGELYAQSGSGFVRLYADGATSKGSKLRLDTLALEAEFYKDQFGKLAITPGSKRTRLDTPKFLAIESDGK